MTITAVGDGSYRISGPLQLATVTAVWREGVNLFQAGRMMRMDLGEVDRVDSTGLALLIAWMREARKQNIGIHFTNIPEQLHEIAQASNLDHLLP